MNRTHHLIIGVVLLSLTGCGPTVKEEANFQDFISAQQEMNQLMKSIHDVRTAEKANPRINTIAEQMISLSETAKNFTKAHRTELAKKYRNQLDAAYGDFGKQIDRMHDTEGGFETMMKSADAMNRVMHAWNDIYRL